jgi:phosphatidylserine decarboxylase
MALIERSGMGIIIAEIAFIVIIYLVNFSLIPILVIILAFTLFFFRDPRREIQEGVVSPADGRIDFVSEGRMEIFMSPFDCHINLSPVSGTVVRTKYIKGSNFPAFMRKANAERNEIYINNEDGDFKVTQIAGMFARRIVCYVREGDKVEKGQKIGMIKFGSRIILEVPLSFRFTKSVGDRVKAGETIAVKKNVQDPL